MRVELEFRFRLGRWAAELSCNHNHKGLWLGLWHYFEGGNSAYPPWQWLVGRRWPVRMKQEQMPTFEFVGVAIAPCEIVKEESWPDVVG